MARRVAWARRGAGRQGPGLVGARPGRSCQRAAIRNQEPEIRRARRRMSRGFSN